MDDEWFGLLQSRMRVQPRSEMMILTPNPESARWVRERWQQRIDGLLLAGVRGDAAATATVTSSHPNADDGLSWATLELAVKTVLSAVTPHDRMMQRLAERLKQQPSVRYIVDEWFPGPDEGGEMLWWEEHDVLLIGPLQLETAKRQFEQLGITLIEVDEAWWKEMGQADWVRRGFLR